MITHFLDKDIVFSYARDLLARLQSDLPEIWIMLGPSGAKTLKAIAVACKDQLENLQAVKVIYDRNSKVINFLDEKDPQALLSGRRVIVVDSTVNSGSTLLAAVRKVEECSPATITTYAIAVQVTTNFIPNYFSILVGAHDRVLFVDSENNAMHNNRFMGNGLFRRLQESDLDKPMLICGKDFIDRTTWADHWYELQTDPFRHCFVFEEKNKIFGFISYWGFEGKELRIDELAVDHQARGRNIGHDLMRWAENHARHMRCQEVTLWSIEDKVDFYRKQCNFAPQDKRLDLRSDGKFFFMRKPLLYSMLPNA